MENDRFRMVTIYKVLCRDCLDGIREREIKELNQINYTEDDAQAVIDAHFFITGHRARFVESQMQLPRRPGDF